MLYIATMEQRGPQRGSDHPLAFLVDPELNYGREAMQRFLRSIGSAQTVLDLGAGSGGDLATARRVLGPAKLIGVDVRPVPPRGLVDVADEIHQLDVERDALPVADGSVDVVIANQVLEHTKELFWILHEVTRSLRRGGHLLIGVPNIAALHNRVLLAMGGHPTQMKAASAHIRGFTRPDLLRFFEDCFPGGYSIAGTAGSQFYPFPRALARPLARVAPSLAAFLFISLRKQSRYERQFLDYPVERQLETNFFLG